MGHHPVRDAGRLAEAPELEVTVPGDWDPWLIWVALAGFVIVAMAGLRTYFSRADTERELEREIERRKSTR